jgi:thymidylate synthase ThyX
MTTIQNPLIKAEIIADSITEKKNRLTTFVLTFPRIVLSEFNTHRAISKNSASSRAIPFKKMVKMVQTNPFIPTAWMKEHSGMQGTEYFTYDEVEQLCILEDHLTARDNAVALAMRQNEKGVSKQICNRYLEPFLMHTVICTGTDWDNFFALRAHPDAEIHIQELAHKMLDAYNQSTPAKMFTGEWHIPFGDRIEDDRLKAAILELHPTYSGLIDLIGLDDYKVKIATARCARVSYLNFEGKDDYAADLKLYSRLLESGHMSPFEHCAKAMNNGEYYGNFEGWKQLRKTLPNENQTDQRVIRK